MLKYLNFCLLCALFALIFYLYIRAKKYITLLKMAEEIFGGYESPQSDSNRQKLFECVLTGNSKLYLGKVYTKDQLIKLSEEEVENFLIIMKLSLRSDGKVFGKFNHKYVFNGSLCSTRNKQSGCIK